MYRSSQNKKGGNFRPFYFGSRKTGPGQFCAFVSSSLAEIELITVFLNVYRCEWGHAQGCSNLYCSLDLDLCTNPYANKSVKIAVQGSISGIEHTVEYILTVHIDDWRLLGWFWLGRTKSWSYYRWQPNQANPDRVGELDTRLDSPIEFKNMKCLMQDFRRLNWICPISATNSSFDFEVD